MTPCAILFKHSTLKWLSYYSTKCLKMTKENIKIYFGAWVSLEDAEGMEKRWRIVGPDEFDLAEGKLSMDSPMARSLLGKALDDEVRVQSPSGEKLYYVTDICYQAAD